ncbi:osteocrin isoform X2 [Siniperca chuatsi]|nr:osteocrin isoform X2 [Siniperca chuatsi]
MQFCGCLLLSFLLSITVLHCSVDGFRVQRHPAQHVDRPMSRSPAALRPRPGGVKAGEELTAKLLRLDDLGGMENDVMEPKRKRSFPGNNAPLDRLSVSSMETKQGTNKQSKAVELPRRRVNPPPIDRIGTSRLPNSRG